MGNGNAKNLFQLVTLSKNIEKLELNFKSGRAKIIPVTE